MVNTLNFRRSGLLELYVDHELLPVDRPFRVVDEVGQPLLVQHVGSRPDGSYWAIWASDIPAFGWRTFQVKLDEGDVRQRAERRAAEAFENAHYRLTVDATRGAVSSLYDKDAGRELIDRDSLWGLGQIVYETLRNREQLEAFTLDECARRSLSDVVIEGVVDGPIWSSLHLRGELPACQAPVGVRCELRLFHPAKQLELHYTIQKRRSFEPEAIYVAFPLASDDGGVGLADHPEFRGRAVVDGPDHDLEQRDSTVPVR